MLNLQMELFIPLMKNTYDLACLLFNYRLKLNRQGKNSYTFSSLCLDGDET